MANRTDGDEGAKPWRVTRVGDVDRPYEGGEWGYEYDDVSVEKRPEGEMDRWNALAKGKTGPLDLLDLLDISLDRDRPWERDCLIPKGPLGKKPEHKLPLLVYFHGGGFCIESAFSPLYHPFCNSIADSANVVIVSVNYRLAPENPIPVPYDDSWEAVKWVMSNNETWLIEHADFDRVFLAGDSAGANIAHHLAIRVGSEGLPGSGLAGIVLIHPYFWGKEPIRGESDDVNKRRLIDNMWLFACPDPNGSSMDDPFINPNIDPRYSGVGCDRVLVCVAEKDVFRERGWDYYERLIESEWKGKAEILETKAENHGFHLFYPDSENGKDFVKRVGSYLNHGKS